MQTLQLSYQSKIKTISTIRGAPFYFVVVDKEPDMEKIVKKMVFKEVLKSLGKMEQENGWKKSHNHIL